MSGLFNKLICLTGLILLFHLHLLHVANSKIQEPLRTEDILCTHLINTKVLEKCCGNSTTSKLFFESSKCDKFEQDYTACRYACMFKHWDMIGIDDELKMANVSFMIDSLYGKKSAYASYGQVLKKSYAECNNLGNIFGDVASVFNAPLKVDNNSTEMCNNVAMLYNKCAATKTFINCPLAHWQENNEDCKQGLQVLSSCVNFFAHQPVRERKRQPKHSGASSFMLRSRIRQPSLHWYTTILKWLVL